MKLTLSIPWKEYIHHNEDKNTKNCGWPWYVCACMCVCLSLCVIMIFHLRKWLKDVIEGVFCRLGWFWGGLLLVWWVSCYNEILKPDCYHFNVWLPYIEIIDKTPNTDDVIASFFSSPVQSTGRAIVLTLASAFPLALAFAFPSRHF